MKVIHFADTHLGVENYGRIDPATGLPSRLLDFLRALDQVVDYAIEEGADLVVFAGDAYKTRDPTPTHQREFAKRIRRLSEAGIPSFLLVGNHDMPVTPSRAHTTEIFATLGVKDVTVARKPGITRVRTRAGVVQVVALPWVTRSGILTKDEHKNRTLAQLDELMLQKLENVLKDELERLDPTLPAILVGHCTVIGATYSSEKSVMLGQDLVLPKSFLARPSLDYVALGHIHKHQVINESPPIVYAGSLERIDFSEEGEEKGFVEVELGARGQEARFRFIPVQARRFLTIETYAKEGDPTEAALAAIARHNVKGAIVKVIVHTSEETRLREADIRQALADASYIAAISQEVERRPRRRLGNVSVERLTPRDAIAAYLQAKGTSPQRLELLLSYVDRLLAGLGYDETTDRGPR